jgi:hypothetical protein
MRGFRGTGGRRMDIHHFVANCGVSHFGAAVAKPA